MRLLMWAIRAIKKSKKMHRCWGSLWSPCSAVFAPLMPWDRNSHQHQRLIVAARQTHAYMRGSSSGSNTYSRTGRWIERLCQVEWEMCAILLCDQVVLCNVCVHASLLLCILYWFFTSFGRQPTAPEGKWTERIELTAQSASCLSYVLSDQNYAVSHSNANLRFIHSRPTCTMPQVVVIKTRVHASMNAWMHGCAYTYTRTGSTYTHVCISRTWTHEHLQTFSPTNSQAAPLCVSTRHEPFSLRHVQSLHPRDFCTGTKGRLSLKFPCFRRRRLLLRCNGEEQEGGLGGWGGGSLNRLFLEDLSRRELQEAYLRVWQRECLWICLDCPSLIVGGSYKRHVRETENLDVFFFNFLRDSTTQKDHEVFMCALVHAGVCVCVGVCTCVCACICACDV